MRPPRNPEIKRKYNKTQYIKRKMSQSSDNFSSLKSAILKHFEIEVMKKCPDYSYDTIKKSFFYPYFETYEGLRDKISCCIQSCSCSDCH